ncbi:MAG: hypothetical protein ACKVQR_00225 [Aquabacterium sp.]
MRTRHHSAPFRLAVVGAGLGSAPHFRSLLDLATPVDVVGRDVQRAVEGIMSASQRGHCVAIDPAEN